MTRFQFEAIDAQGRKQTGSIEAKNQVDAEANLIDRDWKVLSLEPILRSPARTAPLSDREVTELLEQLQAMTRSGLPLPSGLRAASAELESAGLRATFLHLASHLEQGGGLDSALLAQANRFPAHLRGLVIAGSRTGRLADLLGEVVESSNLGHELRRKVWAAIAYPLLILSIVLALVLVICHLADSVVDGVGFDQTLRDFGIPRNGLMIETPIVEITRFVARYDVWMIAGLAMALVVWALIWRFAVSPPARRRLLESIPLFGPMIQFVSLAEFCQLSALLVEAETPLPEALDLAGASVRDPALAEACERMATAVAVGGTLTSALRLWASLPASLGQLLAWGETQESLGEALRFAGDMFEIRAEAQAKFASQAVSAGLLVLILWWIGFAIAAIYLPIVGMIQLLSRLAL